MGLHHAREAWLEGLWDVGEPNVEVLEVVAAVG